MFDNPKKELERLQAQLLAAEEDRTEDDSFCDETYDDSGTGEIFDEELSFLMDEEVPYEDTTRQFSRRSAGFDIPDEPYEMDSRRYVPAPKKKGIGGLLFIAFLEILLAGALIAWWLGWIG